MRETILRLSVPVLLLASVSALAVELRGMSFPEEKTVEGKKLVLNGVGIRRATFLKVEAYDGALYLEKKSEDAKEILDSPGVKHIRMTFLRSIGSGKIRGAWQDSYDDNCKPDCDALRPGIEKLNSWMTDVDKGSTMDVTFAGDQVKVDMNGKTAGTVAMKGFPRIMLSIWLGGHCVDEGLRDGMLGKKKE